MSTQGATPTVAVTKGQSAKVRFEVTGRAPSNYGFIMYMEPGKYDTKQEDSFTTPWSKDFTVEVGSITSLFFAASTGQGSGDLSCAVYVDDKKVTESHTTGDFSNANCSAFLKP